METQDHEPMKESRNHERREVIVQDEKKSIVEESSDRAKRCLETKKREVVLLYEREQRQEHGQVKEQETYLIGLDWMYEER